MPGFFEEALSSLTPEASAKILDSMHAFHELKESADRVTAIVGCAILDNELRDAIQRRLLQDEKALKKFFDDRDGPGHETLAKIQLGYLLGIFDGELRENLQAIGSIR